MKLIMPSKMAASSTLQSSMIPLLSLEMVRRVAACSSIAATNVYSHLSHTSVAGFALPTDPEFWLALFEEARGWGLMT